MMADAVELSINGALPRIRYLHRTHPGVTASLSESFEEAASVCLDRSCSPPTEFALSCAGRLTLRRLTWTKPDDRQRRAWANDTDRIEAAAYGVSLAAVEAELGLVATTRMPTLSGADYFLIPRGQRVDDLEDAFRLEVSGTESTETHRIHARLRAKIAQVAHPSDPSLACVVSFGAKRVLIRQT